MSLYFLDFLQGGHFDPSKTFNLPNELETYVAESEEEKA